MTHAPHLITIERWSPRRGCVPPLPTPPYEFGVWHVPLALDIESQLHIKFTTMPRLPAPDTSNPHLLGDEWVVDLGTIVRKEEKRIWTRAELGSKAFSKLRRMACYGQWVERTPHTTGYSTLYVNNQHAGLTFRYKPDQLQEHGYRPQSLTRI